MTGKWYDHVVLMVCENTGWNSVQDLKFVDYINKNGTVFEHWYGATHPSGPNYRTMLSGQTWSGNEYDGVPRPNIGTRVPYTIVDFAGVPAMRHDPFIDMGPPVLPAPHFTSVAAALNLEGITYLGMDDANNAHSGPLAKADDNVMIAIGFFNGLILPPPARSLFVVLFDEGYGIDYVTNHVFCGMLGTGVPVKQVGSTLSHYNLAQFLCDNWGITDLNEMDPKCKTYAGKNLIDLN